MHATGCGQVIILCYDTLQQDKLLSKLDEHEPEVADNQDEEVRH